LPVLKTARFVSGEQFSFEKPAAQCLQILKVGNGYFASFEKLSVNLKAFGT
jgi:hypothetical protein